MEEEYLCLECEEGIVSISRWDGLHVCPACRTVEGRTGLLPQSYIRPIEELKFSCRIPIGITQTIVTEPKQGED
jgi:hypothetical protein